VAAGLVPILGTQAMTTLWPHIEPRVYALWSLRGSEEVRALHLALLSLRSVLLEGRIPIRWYRHHVEGAFGMGVFRN
jgi:hypothetical protein